MKWLVLVAGIVCLVIAFTMNATMDKGFTSQMNFCERNISSGLFDTSAGLNCTSRASDELESKKTWMWVLGITGVLLTAVPLLLIYVDATEDKRPIAQKMQDLDL